MALDEAMKSDHESEREKSSQKEMDKQKPMVNARLCRLCSPERTYFRQVVGVQIKWGDSKCVVFETSSQMTFDDDEIIDEPDLYE